jgi:hypothetical protein
MKTYTVRQGQDLLDVAIQLYGDMAGVLRLIKDNGLPFTPELAVGQELLYDPNAARNPDVVAHFAERNIIIATATEGPADLGTEIGGLHFDPEHFKTEHFL